MEYIKDHSTNNIFDDKLLFKNGIFFEQKNIENFTNTIDPIITEHCNLACPHCWNTNHSFSLTLEKFLKITKLAKKLNINAVQFSGGEPTLNNNLMDFMQVSKEFGFINRFRSNLCVKLFDKSYLKSILENSHKIYTSLDGLAETNFKLRPTKQYMTTANKTRELFKEEAEENFNLILNNLQNLIKLKKQLNLQPEIIINTVIQKDNIDEILELISFLNTLAIDRIDLTQLVIAKDNPKFIEAEEFLAICLKACEISKHRIKIKTIRDERCLICQVSGDVVLVGSKTNIIIGNYLTGDLDEIKISVDQLSNTNYTYSNYFYTPYNLLM